MKPCQTYNGRIANYLKRYEKATTAKGKFKILHQIRFLTRLEKDKLNEKGL